MTVGMTVNMCKDIHSILQTFVKYLLRTRLCALENRRDNLYSQSNEDGNPQEIIAISCLLGESTGGSKRMSFIPKWGVQGRLPGGSDA